MSLFTGVGIYSVPGALGNRVLEMCSMQMVQIFMRVDNCWEEIDLPEKTAVPLGGFQTSLPSVSALKDKNTVLFRCSLIRNFLLHRRKVMEIKYILLK